MAISAGDVIFLFKGDTKELDKSMSEAEKKLKKQQEELNKRLRITGAIVTGVGAAITGALFMSVKAAAEEDVGIQRLRVAMENVGIAYGGATGELEKWIDKMQQSTAFADSDMRDALASLIVVTEDLTEAQNLLNIATDLARWKNIDLKTASELLMKVYAGDMGLLKRYGIIVDENATKTEALAQIQKMATGQAEAYAKTAAGQMELLKNNMGDLMESVGFALIPMLTSLFGKIQPVIQLVKEWISVHPNLTEKIVLGVAVLGGFMMVLGPLLMILPGLMTAIKMVTAAQWAWNIATMANPIGLIITAVAALIAIGVLLWQNWDKVTKSFEGFGEKMKGIWNSIVGVFEKGINSIVEGLNWLIDKINIIPGVNIGNIGKVNWTSNLKGMANGGIIPGPTLLTNLRTGQPYAVAGENGPESVGGSNITVNINNPSIRSDNDISELTRQVSIELSRQQRIQARLAGV